MSPIRLPWRKSRQEAKDSAKHAKSRRQAAEAELAASERKRQTEDLTVVRPLQRMRAEMITTNHITEEVVRLLKEGRLG
jgi:hypothetical protein